MNQASGNFAPMAGDIASRAGVDLQLFPELAGQRLGLGFAGFDFTAGKFPHPRLIRVGRALRQQNLPVAFDNGGNNIKSF